jgi:YVTN family beta-propeller protein
MKLTSRAAPGLAAAALTCTAILVPAVALASAASGARQARPVTAYIVNNGSDTVTPIRTATKTAGKAIKVGSEPDAIAITPNGKTAYVANGGDAMRTSDTVTPIRTATGKAGKAINVGTGPDAIAITPNGKTAYVTSYGSGTVTPIRISADKAGKAIKVGSGPSEIAITP